MNPRNKYLLIDRSDFQLGVAEYKGNENSSRPGCPWELTFKWEDESISSHWYSEEEIRNSFHLVKLES